MLTLAAAGRSMNPPVINSTSSVSTTKRKREAERSFNWTAEETQVLLCAWSDERVQKSLAENVRNRHVFKHLSARMSEMGFSRSPHQCRLRVKTLKANYVRAKLQRSVDGSQPSSFKYFAEMDAVLGRRSAGGGGPRYVSPAGMAEHHLDSIPSDLNSDTDVGGHHVAPSRTGRHRRSSLEDAAAAQVRSEVKLEDGEDGEDGEDSTDPFEFSDGGFSQHPTGRRGDVYLETAVHRDVNSKVDHGLNAPSLHVLLPPPLTHPAASPLPAPPDRPPDNSPVPAHLHHPESSCLDPALKHLSECFQQLVSEARGLLVQLEGQRQEQARWHQDLLAQWLQREERRQRETAEREERREKARMEHEIRVLELLTGLTRTQGCRCGGRQTASEPMNHTKDKDRN
ncbi:uncharacterized protein [Brachyistius frenatus]|uniref:uncharacterized protein n=1 Tax=Brachyistius frenatus TaxID=100188 RepID=UPI0037E8156E